MSASRAVRPRWLPLARAGAAIAVLASGALLAPVALGAERPPVAATGASDVAWGIRPADGDHGAARDNFRYAMAPGESVTDALVVTNRGTAALALAVYGADGELRDGHVELAGPTVEPGGTGAWLDVVPTLELEPGESVEVPFTLTVPTGTPPGEHAGGLVTSSVADGGSGVAVDRRLAASIVVTVAASAAALPQPPFSSDAAPPGAARPPLAALLGLAALVVVAGAVWFMVVRGRANP